MRTIATALLICACTAPVAGQSHVRLAPGLMWQNGVFGDDAPESTRNAGLTAGLQVRGQTSRLIGAAFDFVLQPFPLDNPHLDESMWSISALAGPEIGRRTYVRPLAGAAMQFWRGSDTEQSVNLALAMGFAVGRRHVAGSRASVEIAGYTTFSHGALSAVLGVQVPFTFTR